MVYRVKRKKIEPKEKQSGKFKQGHAPHNAGRPKGSRNKITIELTQAILQAADMIGFDGLGYEGVPGYLARLALHNEEVFGRLLEKVLPQKVSGKLQIAEDPKTYESREELIQALRARGLPAPMKLIESRPLQTEDDQE